MNEKFEWKIQFHILQKAMSGWNNVVKMQKQSR